MLLRGSRLGRVRNRRRRSVTSIAIFLACAVSAVAASPALGASRVYWGNFAGNKISFTNLDGSGGGDLSTGAATVNEPYGTAIDAAASKIYWPNFGGNKISFASLDGSAGGDLATGAATVNEPVGIAVDPIGGRVYWANFNANKISFANLNGTGGGDIPTGSATVNEPFGVTLDPADGRIFWTNFGGNKISFANLDGSGGGDLKTGTAPVSGPIGLAFDPVGGKIYWANEVGDSIGFVNADGSGAGAGSLTTTGATLMSPLGVAIDAVARRIYWANHDTTKISFANLDGSGGADLATGMATLNAPDFPSLLEPPAGAGAPAISGGSVVPATLTCSQGVWASDLLSSLLYRVPQSFAFRWSLNGTPITGVTTSSITATLPGSYACAVTAVNAAGSATQASAARSVANPPPAPPPVSAPAATARLASVSPSGSAQLLTLACDGVRGQQCATGIVGTVHEHTRGASIVAVTARAPRAHGGKPKTTAVTVTVVRATVTVAAGRSATAMLTLNGAGKGLLARFQRLPVRLVFSGSITATRTVVFTLARLRVRIPADNWFHINLPCGNCYTRAQHVPITGLPAKARISVSCRGGGCPYRRRSFTAHGRQFDLASALRGSHLEPGSVVDVTIAAPGRTGVVVRYAIQRGAVPVRSLLCPAPGDRSPGRCT
jgi:hypothetical protein